MGIISFKSKFVEDLCIGVKSKKLRTLLPLELHRNAIKKIQIIRAAKSLNDIANFPGLKLEKLKGSRKNEYSIRINDQYRICFHWDGRDALNVNIEDYH